MPKDERRISFADKILIQESKINFDTLTLQSKANLLASMMAAFLSLADSNANTKETPFFACQNNA
jgi:hypothetical protein